MVIDAHLHLWDKQHGMVNGKPVYDIGGGKSDFGGVVKQMMPAYMTDGVNSAERLIANMDFAQVNAAVVVQEYIDGNQYGTSGKGEIRTPLGFINQLIPEREVEVNTHKDFGHHHNRHHPQT